MCWYGSKSVLYHPGAGGHELKRLSHVFRTGGVFFSVWFEPRLCYGRGRLLSSGFTDGVAVAQQRLSTGFMDSIFVFFVESF